jgi:hypothetical protein
MGKDAKATTAKKGAPAKVGLDVLQSEQTLQKIGHSLCASITETKSWFHGGCWRMMGERSLRFPHQIRSRMLIRGKWTSSKFQLAPTCLCFICTSSHVVKACLARPPEER